MTVTQITQLLGSNDVSIDIINDLKQDSRISVSRLLMKWEQRQEKLLLEKERIQGLYEQERLLKNCGYDLIAGVDEAGRGPLAGPVVVGAVILPLGFHLPLINDSKKLSAKQREELYDVIKEVAIDVQSTVIDIETIDHVNIYQATILGMYRTIGQFSPQPHAVLIDAVPLPDLAMPSVSLIGGDAISASIGAASIIAKVERDRLMLKLDEEYPQYGFAKHKGYGTAEHMRALQQYGPCPIHRKSFEPIKSWKTTNHE
ncbi:ribonuclease HII [Pelosinus sp. sgz500959]|uniref:ribonuclease HII n=1 Tax=Pelosinus sp. sgz500959 TaxID=3242472 RepID=UPI00366BCBFB